MFAIFRDYKEQHIYFEINKSLNVFKDKYFSVSQFKLLSAFGIVSLDCVIRIGKNRSDKYCQLIFLKNLKFTFLAAIFETFYCKLTSIKFSQFLKNM